MTTSPHSRRGSPSVMTEPAETVEAAVAFVAGILRGG